MSSEVEDQAPQQEAEDPRIVLIRKVVEELGEGLRRFIEGGIPPSDSRMSVLFERAEFLLKKAEAHLERRIDAYRLFEPNGPFMSAREISERFREVGWKGKATGHVTIGKRILELISLVEEEVRRRQELYAGLFAISPAGQSFSDKLDAEVAQLIHRLSISQVVTDASRLKEAISRHIERLLDGHHQRGQDKFLREDSAALLAVSRFMKFVCDARSLEEFTMKGAYRSVRPYELFLFASQNGLMEDFLKSRLDRILEVKLSPFVESSLSILETFGGIECETGDAT